jgi:hypothetical protein
VSPSSSLLLATLFAATAALPVAGQDTINEPVRPLAGLVSQPIVFAPVQSVRGGSAVGWRSAIGDVNAYALALDEEISAAIAERGVRKWMMPDQLARLAKRSPTMRIDPYVLAVDRFAAAERKADEAIPDPLGSQLRALTILGDARYALVPSEVRFERDAKDSTQVRAVLTLYLVDTRASRIMGKSKVPSDPVREFSPSIAANIASRLADLIAAP